MATKTQRKKRYQRRRAHAVLTHGRPGLVAAIERITEQPLYPYQKAIAEAVVQQHAFSSIPTRAPCPECGFSQKVKRDGTMGRHDVGTETKRQCAGTGRKFNE